MTDYNIQPFNIILNSCGESIYTTKITPKFVYLDAYDDCGELWLKGLKRKVRYHEKYLYVAVFPNDNYVLVHLP
tara:strand:+ start:1246 stop:1467 length:222 start_codon:yes stop_codon:yes gene_type:complete